MESSETKRNAFIEAAHEYYICRTDKTYDELRNYVKSEWVDGITGDEWDSVAEAIACGEEAATQLLEEEMEA